MLLKLQSFLRSLANGAHKQVKPVSEIYFARLQVYLRTRQEHPDIFTFSKEHIFLLVFGAFQVSP